MKQLEAKVNRRITNLCKEITQIYESHQDHVIGKITVKHLLGGMRGLKAMVCNTSFVDPHQGLFISGYSVAEFEAKTPEEIFFLLCTGEFPNDSELSELKEELAERAEVPAYVWTMLKSLPQETHPMTMFSMGILAMEGESVFKKKYLAGIPKSDYWKYTLKDSLNLIAKLPSLAAGIYKILFMNGRLIPPDAELDMAGNLTKMLGINNKDKSFADLIRLYLVLHCDHEGGNVSAFTARVVNSALSNIFYATSAGLNGLAGPLHGLANQVCLHFITRIHDQFGLDASKEEVHLFVLDTLNSGNVIPGYGHAVLRETDPRFTAFMRFGENHCSDSPYFKTVKKLFEVTPPILKNYKGGKIANPWPNVDAISGSLLYHYGMTHYDFYTVMFGISRTLGFCAQNIIARGLNQPIIRPKSITNQGLKGLTKGL
ncbi:citrate (Si)-synthase [Sunxiuqinia sp. sy24]|uniref:citrate (Si)-synthase n=1 Tax=Sunxiuqinia sp. sy24 TaxID=3461495 RepID=UPI004045B1DC